MRKLVFIVFQMIYSCYKPYTDSCCSVSLGDTQQTHSPPPSTTTFLSLSPSTSLPPSYPRVVSSMKT